MNVAFVCGLALELAGATMLAASVLTARAGDVASRGIVYPTSGDPQQESQVEPARAIVGFGLLAIGFLVQIVAYAVDSGWCLLLVALAVGLGAMLVGWLAVRWAVVPWLHGRAVKHHRGT